MTEPRVDVAIVGMSCVFPGAENHHRYWENILHKVDAISDPPDDWEPELFYDEEPGANDRTYCKRGGYLGDLAAFDPSAYGVVPNSVDGTEPDHFLALRAAHDALVDAGYKDIGRFRERTEVIVGRGTYVNRGNMTAMQHGVMVDSFLRILKQLHPEHTDEDLARVKEALKESLPPFHSDTAPGLVPNIISGRIANRLDLMGANYIVDAACASSLVAVDLAIRDLQSGRCDMAVAGGVNASVPPVIMMIFSQLNALSRKGEIKPFSEDADGTLLGEGVGMVVLKRLADAESDGDKIYAVLRGVGVASDGKAIGLLAPRLEGEELALRRAYEQAGVPPDTVGLVEAHGTATLVGDAVEFHALSKVFGTSAAGRCAIGSVKSMISHTMPASGIAGLIKVALALRHKVLPPTLHSGVPNPKLRLETSPFYLNTETRPWIHGSTQSPRRAGVNAFGFGGINAHAVLEEYTGEEPSEWLQRDWDHELFVVSARDNESLAAAVLASLEQVNAADSSLAFRHLAWAVTCSAPLQKARLAIVASDRVDLSRKLRRAVERLQKNCNRRIRDVEGTFFYPSPLGAESKIAFVYPGEGGQYRGMLNDLCIHFPQARSWFDLMDETFEDHPRGYKLSEAIFPPPGASDERMFSMDIGAEAVFCANQALYAVLESLGVRCDGMVGHSTGEHSALLNSGIVRADEKHELIRHIRNVNAVFEQLNSTSRIESGVLLAVAGADRNSLHRLVLEHDRLYIALDNCPNQVVLFGTSEAIASAEAALASTSAVCQKLPFGRAYHTPLFHDFSQELLRHFATLQIGVPRVPVYSCVTAQRFPDAADEIRAQASVQWEHTVRFRETIEKMHEDGYRVFLEVGPRGNLASCVGDILRGKDYSAIPCDLQHRSSIQQLQHAVAELVAHHVPVSLVKLFQHRGTPPTLDVEKNRPSPKLSMGLQPLRLPAEFRLAKAAPLPPETAASISNPSHTPMADVMAAQLQVMGQFLQTQQQVLQSYLATRNGATIPKVDTNTSHPFVTKVLECVPGVRATAVHRFSVAEQPFLKDHTFGRVVSAEDATLSGLPVVPLTITMEVLAEGAALVVPGKVVVGMRDVRATRWLTLEHGELEIEIKAEIESGPDRVRVSIRHRSQDPLRPICAEGTVLFADAYSAPPAVGGTRLREERNSTWQADDLYSKGMFHGPAFRAVRSIDRVAPGGTVGTLEVLPRNGLLRSNAVPSFLVDPIILDAAGQVVAFWSQEVLQPAGDIFPYRLAALDCYAPPSSPGTKFECRVSATVVTATEIHSDIEIAGRDGHIHYAFRGWEDRRFLVPQSLWDLRISPMTASIGRMWPDPVRHQPRSVCSRVEFPSEILEASHRIWSKVLAHLVLSKHEREEWYRLSGNTKRSSDWLIGRCAAKDAVRRLVKDGTGREIYAADVVIKADEQGRRYATGAWVKDFGVEPTISISHSAGVGVAIASAVPGERIGVDIEPLARDVTGFETEAFTPIELDLLGKSVPQHTLAEWYLRAWCAKESLVKALGRGFSGGVHSTVITGLQAESGGVEMQLREGLANLHPALSRRTIPVRTIRDEKWICSTAVVHET